MMSFQGDTYAKNGLGMMYRDGLGVKKDRNRALSYFQAASGEVLPETQINLGRTEAHVNLGRMYLGKHSCLRLLLRWQLKKETRCIRRWGQANGISVF